MNLKWKSKLVVLLLQTLVSFVAYSQGNNLDDLIPDELPAAGAPAGAKAAEAPKAAEASKPAEAPKPAPKEEVILEELPSHRLLFTNIRSLGEEFKNVDRVAFSPDGKSLLVDRMRPGRRFELLEIPFERSGEVREISSQKSNSSRNFHNGSGVWLPDGRGVVFVAQNEGIRDFVNSIPSIGHQANLWFADAQSRNFTQLTRVYGSLTRPSGVSMPTFSPDGKYLFWCGADGARREQSIWGGRALFVGSFELSGSSARLTGVKSFKPGKMHDFYESYGFSPDGKNLLFSAVMNEDVPWYMMDICTMSPDGTEVTNLTSSPGVWDRYASYSPKGNKITWSSSSGMRIAYMGIGGSRWQLELRSELWMMRSDGREWKKLTNFNRRGSVESRLVNGLRTFIGTSAWHPDGNKLAFVVYYDVPGPGVGYESCVFVGDLIEGISVDGR